MKERFKQVIAKEEIKYYFIIIIISLMVCSLLLIGYPDGHDTIYHISKAVGTEIALKEGQILPLITSNYMNDFGYSWNIFYPPLSNYIMMAIKVFTHSYVTALNILIFLSILVSGIAMFNFIKRVTKSNNVALLVAIIYMLAPYRLVDIYIRGALGEVMAFMFLPFVFHGIYNIFEGDGKRHYLLAIGAIGLLLSHNISTLLTIIAVAIYVLINIKKLFNKKVIKYLVINVVFIVVIVMFFYGPMLQNKMATDYAVFNETKIDKELLHDYSVYFYQLLFGKMQHGGSYPLDVADSQNVDMCFALGLTILVPVLFTPFVYKKIDKSKRKIYLTTLFIGILFLVLTTTIIPWNQLPDFIVFIQFTYRFLLTATFFLSIIAGINIYKISEALDLKTVMLYTMITLMYITPLMNVAKINSVDWKKFYTTEIMEEGQTFSDFSATYEYLPSKAFNNKNYIATRSQDPIIEEGSGDISEVNKENLEITFYIENVEKDTIIELPFIYYQGYTASVNGEKAEISESNNGFIQITFREGENGIVEVKYTGTIWYYVSLMISIIGTIIFITYIIFKEYKGKKRNEKNN